MSLLKDFRTTEGLPSPRGSLSSSLAPTAIAKANQAVEKIISEEKQPKKRGPYKKYNPETRAAIGEYAVTNGVAAASRFFTRKLKHPVSTSTVLCIKKAYLEERRMRRDQCVYEQIKMLPVKQRGRPLMLGRLDSKVQAYLRKLRESGGTITTRIVMAVARAIVLHYDFSMLKEHGGHVDIGRNWAISLSLRKNEVCDEEGNHVNGQRNEF